MKNWIVGWNMPGYLPEDEPYVHSSWEKAHADLIEELDRAADDYASDDPELAKPYDSAIEEVKKAAPNEPVQVHVGSYVWWIEPTDEPTTSDED